MIDLSIWKAGWAILSTREKRASWLVLGVMILGALASALMVGSVMPFLAVMADASLIQETPAMAWAYDFFSFTSAYSFLICLGLASFFTIVMSSLIQIMRAWVSTRFAMMRMHSVSHRLLENYLSQPYAFFLNRHSGEMGPRVLAESEQIMIRFFRPAAEAIASCLTTLAIVGLLLWVEPVIGMISFSILGGIYCTIYLSTKRIISRVGEDRVNANTARFRHANDSLAGIKDIKLLGREVSYLDRYEHVSIRWARTLIKIDILTQVPQYAMQALALGGIIILCIVMIDPIAVDSGKALGDFLPIIGLFAFAGQRLLPELSKFYQSMGLIQSGSAVVAALYEDLVVRKSVLKISRAPIEGLGLRQLIQLDGVSYNYPNSQNSGVRDVTVSIRAGEKIGIVGGTGAGKTTLVDIILGLLEPDCGHLLVDGTKIISKNLRMWMQSVGYVPQDIFLTDESIAENIALGVPLEDIDYDRVHSAARTARISHFILDELPQGYQTYVGERGVRLSGGQRQRIGIARALYNDANLIVFDEATSALDNLTEAEVMEAIDALPGDKTVLMIAHRLTTVRQCDRIVVLENGRIVGCDNWNNLMKKNTAFQRIARLDDVA